MSTLPTINPSQAILLRLEPLTPSAFSPFGTAIASPVQPNQTAFPTSTVTAQHAPYQVNPQPANQNTALKTSPISPLINNYPPPDSAKGRSEAKGLMSVFSCFPRRNLYLSPEAGKDGRQELRLKVAILERHPFTTQTFCPFNFSGPRARSEYDGEKTYFLVIVAPTLGAPTSNPSNPPDLSGMRAFLAPTTLNTSDGNSGFAVTYNAGTWHAPMIVLGQRRVDFLVSQFANGKGEDDCQEVLVGGDEKIVEVSLDGLGLQLAKGDTDAGGRQTSKL